MKRQLISSIKGGAVFGTVFGAIYLIIHITESLVGGFDLSRFILAILMGIGKGLVLGGAFCLVLFLFCVFLAKKFKKVKEELSKERDILFDGPSNHFVGSEGVGGWLFLSSDTLCFRSHAFNFNRHTMEIPLSEITSVERCRIHGLANTGILVHTVGGNEERFVVDPPAEWVEKLNGLLADNTTLL